MSEVSTEPVVMPTPRRYTRADDVLTRLYEPTVEVDGCLIRYCGVTANGYTHILYQKKYWKAHRLAYELEVGPIPDGLTIDHLCRNRACINTAHLQVVTVEENSRRRHNWMDGKCSKGHDVSRPENLGTGGSGRVRCRLCWNEYMREFREGRRRSHDDT